MGGEHGGQQWPVPPAMMALRATLRDGLFSAYPKLAAKGAMHDPGGYFDFLVA